MPNEARDPLNEAVDQACKGSPEPLYVFLERHSALPGPKPNHRFAMTAAQALASRGELGAKVLRSLRELGPARARAQTTGEFLPMVGLLGTALQAARGKAMARDLGVLQPMAEDERSHVRTILPIALREAIHARGDEAIEAMSGWMDGYLQSVAVLEAIADPSTLQPLREPGPIVERLEAAFALAENAPRAHERSQGYRTLVRVLGRAPATIGKRFPAEIAEWLTARAETQVPELRESIDAALKALREAGVRAVDLEAAEQALAASKPAPRDPRSYVGPTRSRGTKARKRGKH